MSFPSYSIIPVIFLILTVVTSIIIMGWNLVTPIITAGLHNVNAPSSYITDYTNVGNNLITIGNVYLPLVFFFAMLGTILSTLFLPVNPLNWLIGLILLPFTYYIIAWIDNIARMVLTFPVLASGVNQMPLTLQVWANMDKIVILFAIIYVVALGIRIYFYNPNAQVGNNNGGGQPAPY